MISIEHGHRAKPPYKVGDVISQYLITWSIRPHNDQAERVKRYCPAFTVESKLEMTGKLSRIVVWTPVPQASLIRALKNQTQQDDYLITS